MSIESNYKKLFSNQQHKQAIDYLKENKEQFDPALYHYNLGVNYVKTNQLSLARLHFEKSKSTGFYSVEVAENLDQVKDLLQVKRIEEKSAVSDYIYEAGMSFSIYTGVNITLIFLILFLFQMKKITKLWLKAFIGVLALAPMGSQLYLKKNYEEMVALDKKNVLRGPSAIFEQIQEVPPGMRYIVSKDHNGWRYIVSPSSHKGWTKSGKEAKL